MRGSHVAKDRIQHALLGMSEAERQDLMQVSDQRPRHNREPVFFHHLAPAQGHAEL